MHGPHETDAQSDALARTLRSACGRLPAVATWPARARGTHVAAALGIALTLAACEKPSATPSPAPAPSVGSGAGAGQNTPSAAPAAAPPKDEVKISKENWPNGKLKYFHELRRGPDGKWARNGVGRAYYDHGVLEREGTYKNNVRVGEWKYYDAEGKLLRTEERGEGKPEAS